MNQRQSTILGSRLLALFCLMAWAAIFPSRSFAAIQKEDLGFHVRRWTTEHGLPQDRISCLKQTRDGYLWIGTWDGLVRFDGVKLTVFNHYNTPGLKKEDDACINALAEDKEGTLWIATKGGLIFGRNNRFEKLELPKEIGDKIWSLCAASEGGIWFSGDNHVVRFRDGVFSSVFLTNQGGIKLTMCEATDGGLNMLLTRKWVKVSPDGSTLTTNRLILPNEPKWQALSRDSEQGVVWIGTTEGVLRHDGRDVSLPSNQNLASNDVDFLYRDTIGRLWAKVSHQALFLGDGTNFNRVNLLDFGAQPSTTCMEEDFEGGFWVGTDRGLFLLHKKSVRVYTSKNSQRTENIWSVCEDKDGKVWAVGDNGVSVVQNGYLELFKAKEPEPMYRGRCVWPSKDGGVWLGKVHGLVYQIRGKKFSRSLYGSVLPAESPEAFYEDRSGRIWVGNKRGAMAIDPAHPNQLAFDPKESGLKEIRAILEDHAGNIWLGSKKNGLTRLRDGVITTFQMRDGLSDVGVWCICEDSAGTLWFGSGNGLTRYQNGNFFALTKAHGLREEKVNSVLEDGQGNLWLSGQDGIYRVKKAELNAVADGKSSTFQSIRLGTVDGLETAETNGERQPSAWKSKDGRLWFATTRGLAVIDPDGIRIRNDPVRIVIERVEADGKFVFNNSVNLLDPDLNESAQPVTIAAAASHILEINYTANSFSRPEKLPFRYRLKGVDAEWQNETYDRSVRYLNLPPGPYSFEVKAANPHGNWSEPSTFHFVIEPHPWQTWSFYVLCGIFVIGMIGSVHFYRLRWQKRLLKLDEQHALATERARIARDLHDELGTALTGLALELDVVGREANHAETKNNRVTKASDNARGLAQRMREVVWAINPRCDNTSSLTDFLEEQIVQFLNNAGIQVRLDFPETIPTLPIEAETRHQLALCVRETLTNIVRHSGATQVTVRLEFTHNTILLMISDNGCGFVVKSTLGNGLINMRERIEKINGTFNITSTRGSGTESRFAVPVSKILDRD